MVDDQKMYQRLFQETVKAIRILEKAQQECEELYMISSEPELTVFSRKERNEAEH